MSLVGIRGIERHSLVYVDGWKETELRGSDSVSTWSGRAGELQPGLELPEDFPAKLVSEESRTIRGGSSLDWAWVSHRRFLPCLNFTDGNQRANRHSQTLWFFDAGSSRYPMGPRSHSGPLGGFGAGLPLPLPAAPPTLTTHHR